MGRTNEKRRHLLGPNETGRRPSFFLKSLGSVGSCPLGLFASLCQLFTHPHLHPTFAGHVASGVSALQAARDVSPRPFRRCAAMTTGWCPIFSMYLGKGVQDSQDVSRYLLFFWGVMSHFQRYFAGSRPLLTSLWKQRRLQLGRLRHTQLS